MSRQGAIKKETYVVKLAEAEPLLEIDELADLDSDELLLDEEEELGLKDIEADLDELLDDDSEDDKDEDCASIAFPLTTCTFPSLDKGYHRAINLITPEVTLAVATVKITSSDTIFSASTLDNSTLESGEASCHISPAIRLVAVI